MDGRELPQRMAFNRAQLLQHADSLGIHWETLPKPIMFSSLLGYSDSWYRAEVIASVLKPSVDIQRPLNQMETDAISQSVAKAMRTRSMELPFTLGSAFFFERRGRQQLKFPLMTPPKDFDLDVFKNKYLPMLSGQQARLAIHSVRFALYGVMSHVVIGGFLLSYATSVSAVEMRTDKRLDGFVQDLQKFIRARKDRRHATDRQGGLPMPQQSPGQADDASPTNYDQQAWSSQEKAASGSEEEIRRRQEILAQAARPSYGQQPTRPEATGSVFDEGSMFDDASPVAPAEQREQQRRALRGGSAWDRIREEAKNDPSTGPGTSPSASSSRPGGFWSTRPGMPPQRGSDSQQGSGEYSYSRAEEEKSYAKQQAQKEFDEMLERERRGEETGRRR